MSNFDYSLLVHKDQQFIYTVFVGTNGYFDPEYFHTSRFTEKSDVYSLGVVLFRVLCARKTISVEEDYGDERRLLSTWVVECIEAESVEEIIDPFLMGKISPLCLKCVLKSETERPPMSDVVRNLEFALWLTLEEDITCKGIDSKGGRHVGSKNAYSICKWRKSSKCQGFRMLMDGYIYPLHLKFVGELGTRCVEQAC
ncbi:receptor-like protein kinase FERONIA [Cornus florida]|uniref:receptor-like protein kinase FERONIA n=1 Tax=Cornus florida TaxID=4283 RepID=UPI0028974A92|nr:receptor-like protein kinase FERONIA [Cornus florida]